jgi:hypothetical protein
MVEGASVTSWEMSKIQTKTRRYELAALEKPSIQSKPCRIYHRMKRIPSDLWQLPVRKSGLPLYRLSSRQKIRFLNALSEKSQYPVDHIQLYRVYDRILIGLYQSVSVTSTGYLECIFKPELIPSQEGWGQRSLKRSKQHLAYQNNQQYYLVVGRLVHSPSQTFQVLIPQSLESQAS